MRTKQFWENDKYVYLLFWIALIPLPLPCISDKPLSSSKLSLVVPLKGNATQTAVIYTFLQGPIPGVLYIGTESEANSPQWAKGNKKPLPTLSRNNLKKLVLD